MSNGNNTDVMLSQSIDASAIAAFESIANGESKEMAAEVVEERKPYTAPSLADLSSPEAVARVAKALSLPPALIEKMLPEVLTALTGSAPQPGKQSVSRLETQEGEPLALGDEPQDPYGHYAPMPEASYAWEPACYERIDEHGCAPMAGAILFGRSERPGKSALLAFKCTHPMKVLDRAGRVRSVREGSTIIVTETTRLGSLAQYAHLSEGCISVFLQPTDWIELSDGTREYGYVVKVEPDTKDPRRMRLVPREVVEGRR